MVNQPAPTATITANVTPAASSSSVDFDYSGPPVTVSNEMALDLVRQFGIHNAWLAFLKVRGLRLSGEEAAKSKALRRFRARIKKLKSTVETLRDRSDDVSTFMAKEFDTFLEPNSIELKKGGDGEDGEESEDGEEEEGSLAIDEEEEGTGGLAMPTTSSLLQVISKRSTGAGTVPAPTIGGTSSNSRNNNSNSNNIAASLSGHQPLPPQQSSPPLAVDTAKEQLAKRHQETIDDVVSSILDKIHNNVPMEGEQAAAAAATAAVAAASASAAAAAAANSVGGPVPNSVHSPPMGKSSAQSKKGGGGGGSKAKKAAANNNSVVSGNSIPTYPLLGAAASAPSRGKGKRGKIGGGVGNSTTMTVMSSGTVAAYPTPIGISPTVGGPHHYPVVSTSATTQHLPPGTKLISHGGTHQHQQQPLSVQPTTTFQLPFGAVPITLAPAAGTAAGHHGHIGSGERAGAITLPSTVTVQALIQSLQQQHPGQPVKHLQFVQAAPPPHHQSHQQQQLGPSPPLPDSSQDVHQRATAGAGQFTTTITTTSSSFATTSSAAGGKRGKKAKGTVASAVSSPPGPVVIKSPYRIANTYSNTPTVLSPPSSSSATTKPSSTDIKSEGGGATAKKTTKRGATNKGASKGEVEQEAVVGSSGGGQKHPGGKSTEATGDVKKLREQQEADRSRIDELEKELSKCQRQLNVERNKNAGQKKKLDKTQAELEKSMDAIQLVQIDLACQKTDNNNLSAENIALRAELQQLRSKGASSSKSLAVASTSTKTAAASTSKASTSGRGAGAASTSSANNNTSGKRKTNNSSQDVPKIGDETVTALLEPMEYGRRQSKRICVARNRFLYNMF